MLLLSPPVLNSPDHRNQDRVRYHLHNPSLPEPALWHGQETVPQLRTHAAEEARRLLAVAAEKYSTNSVTLFDPIRMR